MPLVFEIEKVNDAPEGCHVQRASRGVGLRCEDVCHTALEVAYVQRRKERKGDHIVRVLYHST